MKVVNRLLICLVVFLFSSAVFADKLESPEANKVFAEQAMQKISTGKIVEAFSDFKKYWPMPASEIDQLALQVQNQMNQVGGRFGDPVGFEFIKTQMAGSSLQAIFYLQKFTNHALVWKFRFYKPNNKWLINSVKYSDDMNSLFSDS